MQIDRSEFHQEMEIITIENDDFCQESIASNHNEWIKTDSLILNIEAKALTEGGEMLDDRIIEAAQDILNKQFPGINGFQPAILGLADISFTPLSKDMVQILIKGNSQCGHWFNISALTLKPGYVSINHSLNLELDSNVKKSNICNLKTRGYYYYCKQSSCATATLFY